MRKACLLVTPQPCRKAYRRAVNLTRIMPPPRAQRGAAAQDGSDDRVRGPSVGLWDAAPCGGASLRVGHWSWADKVCCWVDRPVGNLQERG